MSHLPPVPAGNQSPFPIEEPPHPTVEGPDGERPGAPKSAIEQGIASAKAAVSPLADKATTFARERPWATAALVGTIALAVFNSLRGKRA